ncbi:hypothetical protein ACERII_14260 [Evansella sp. AB-rgal1]|uniref:hypothetical protein n=1 Tax=Evansella sp. AB-rgal1 TaxID=3242696 RepID=UPI00359D99EB
MTDQYKKEEKIHHHKEENPSLLGATFIKYLFIAIITLGILFFIAFYVLPLFDQSEGDGEQGNSEEDSPVLEIEINDSDGDENEGE